MATRGLETLWLDPQMQAAAIKQAELAPDLAGSYASQPIEVLRQAYRDERRYWNEDPPDLERVEDTSFPGPVGPIPARIYRPKNDSLQPGLIYLHGGGWIVGDLDTHDKITRILAKETGFTVIAVDYRLAPEHKFPTQLQEAVAVADALASGARDWCIDSSRLAVGGDSAGANLSAACCLERPGLFQAAVLFYGAFGLRDSRSRRRFSNAADGMSAEDLAFYKSCLIRSPEDLHDPRIDILSGAIDALPPSFITATTLDPLLDDSLCLADLMARAGIPHELRVYEGVLHGYLHLSRMVDTASRTLREAATWLSGRLASG